MTRQEEQNDTSLKLVLFLGFAVLIALALLLEFWLAPMIFTEQKDAGRDIAENTMDESAVQDYRWFRQQWHDIEAQRAQVENYKQDKEEFYEIYGKNPDDWPRDARQRHSRINDRITGSENMLETMIADYNARSDDATRAIFQCGLPYSVDEKLYIADQSGVEYTSQEARQMEPPEDPSQCQYASAPSTDQ